jgi:hypothetical protein
VLTPLGVGGPQPPTPTVTEFVPGQPDPLAATQSPQARLGYYDRPYRLFSRRR